MKILFSSLGSHGHTYPLLPLAIAARERGDDVVFGTSADFAPAVERHGIRHFTTGLAIRQAFIETLGGDPDTTPTDVTPDVIVELFGTVLPRRIYDDTTALLADWRPDLVVHEIGAPGAGIAARVAGIPALCHGFGRMWEPEHMPIDPTAKLPLAEELGIELPASNPAGLGNPFIDVCPPSVQNKQFLAEHDTIPLRPVPFSEPGELPSWVTAHEQPLIYLTLGTAFGDARVLRAAIDGLATVKGARVLVAAGPSVEVDALAGVPENVTVLPWVPQAELMPHVDLLVHHGGSGTTMGGFGVGVPQLVLPQGADQYSNAAVVAEHGLGRQLRGDEVTAGTVAEQARALLADEEVRAAGRAMAAEVAAMPSPADVAARLSDYAG
ncbi:glycosyltransferase [Saccharothrix obliqua]|uniref:glycosyltransferase n=1 Tax=Saccharothrix obliqua TaxID=2861747 RepID=UPI001C5EA72A|nr:glycosyltransferase [Saccharothrix obliqua]MBW4721319.1 glycosyltransferase [Saccharothrix obliqua]